MIAHLSWISPYDGRHSTATLSDAGVWTSSVPFLVGMLNGLLAMEDRSPGLGDVELAHAHKMARILDARLEVGSPPKSDPNIVH